jgi:hypothetical protein
LFAKLWAIPGVRRWQTGDREMRAVLPTEALTLVAGVIRARRRRSPDAAAHLQKPAGAPYTATSQFQDRLHAGTPGPLASAGVRHAPVRTQ